MIIQLEPRGRLKRMDLPDSAHDGRPTLRTAPLGWIDDSWPAAFVWPMLRDYLGNSCV
jgi:hypothetical protein